MPYAKMASITAQKPKPHPENRENVHTQPTGQNQQTETEGNTSSQPPNILLQETEAETE